MGELMAPPSATGVIVYLGLGSNLGDRAAHLWDAVQRLGLLPLTRVTRLSPLYESAPVGPVAQGLFLNAVVAVETSLAADALLDGLQAIERAVGRVPTERWGPRVVDLDILLYGRSQIATDRLIVPHVELWNRRFVLVPLLDVATELDVRETAIARLATLGVDQLLEPYLSSAASVLSMTL